MEEKRDRRNLADGAAVTKSLSYLWHTTDHLSGGRNKPRPGLTGRPSARRQHKTGTGTCGNRHQQQPMPPCQCSLAGQPVVSEKQLAQSKANSQNPPPPVSAAACPTPATQCQCS
ncbi:hypothetical protein VFPFJ_07038 [Purpureocillium lilacinum]|uniref:Uncharacterized protein n=1 Tax=Purpureocillium lilacinum TaxID=33203 RepID=A0A179HGH0_PURLI|nr:hypothetical protein VFPFJ_07038 [Purpureocillium lilacinum]OAQ88573.1 hypothetical protein VFPFJ_07038 [Purpureocillium lilacinum]